MSGQVSLLLMGTPHTILMANLGMADSLILMVMALVVFGPRRLPQIGRQIGKLMYEFRKASNDFKFQMEEELRNAEDADRRKKEEEARLRTVALADPPPTAVTETSSPISEAKQDAPSFTEAPSSTESAASQTVAEETYPRIQPPRTGEQVSAPRPYAPILTDAAAEAGASANFEPDAAPSALPGHAPAEEPTPEQAAHHG